MSRTLTLRGVTGSVRWSYHTAAVLSGWSVTPNPDKTFTLKAALETFDAFRLTQRPLVFSVPTKSGSWDWPITDLKHSGATLTATLAARSPEK